MIQQPKNKETDWKICQKEVSRLSVNELIPFEQVEPFKRLALLLDEKVKDFIRLKIEEAEKRGYEFGMARDIEQEKEIRAKARKQALEEVLEIIIKMQATKRISGIVEEIKSLQSQQGDKV